MINKVKTLFKRTPSSKKFFTDIEQLIASTNKRIGSDSNGRLKLILHVGTPKTGTTSVQAYLDKKQRKLRSKGILFPNRFHNPNAPKHQWFERNLVSVNTESLLDNFADILNHVEEHTHTILLSSEGIYNQWWDFPDESKALLLELNSLFNVEIWVWFKEPLAFAESFYKQCMRNPQVANINCYGKDLSFSEVLGDPWFSRQLNYVGFVNECDELFGKNAVKLFQCDKDTVSTVRQLLGFNISNANQSTHKNKCMNSVTAELYRVINRLPLSAKEKEKLVPHMNELDAVVALYRNRVKASLIDDKSREKILTMTTKGMLKIQKRYVSI